MMRSEASVGQINCPEEVEKDANRCKWRLVPMDIVHALYNTIILIVVDRYSTTDDYWWYNVIATILSYNGIGFNLLIRWAPFLRLIDNCLARSCFACRCLNLTPERRELYINLGSFIPTFGMMAYGQYVIWEDYYWPIKDDAQAITAWITAWLYMVKCFGFTWDIFYLDVKYKLGTVASFFCGKTFCCFQRCCCGEE
jgi:hypothetical protein